MSFLARLCARSCLAIALTAGFSLSARAADGLVTVPSAFGVKQTIDMLEGVVKAGGATIFARVDHAGGATAAGLALKPTELLIFGNPKVGTALMQAQQTAGIDLPMKALAWEDAAGKTWVSYNDPAWVAKRHSLPADLTKLVEGMSAGLKGAVSKATTP